MNEDSCSFMIVFQCNDFMYDCECFLLFLFFALYAIHIVSTITIFEDVYFLN